MLKKFRTFIFIFSPTVISVVIWIASKFLTETDSQNFWQTLTQISAVVGTTMFATTFILSTRWKCVEKFFGGFDSAYKAHKYNGIFGYLFIFVHFIALLIPRLGNLQILTDYILPFSGWAYNTGIISFYLFSILLLLTFLPKIPYHLWKRTHEFMGISMILATLHVFLIKSDTSEFLPLRVWILGISVFSLFAFFYQRFIWPNFVTKYDYKISEIDDFGKVIDIYLSPISKKMEYKPGQYVFLITPQISQEKHPFTISSSPEECSIRLSIKKLGDYTNKLSSLKVGDGVYMMGPFGEFGDKFMASNEKMVWLAGGIGVAPFLGFVRTKIAQSKNIDFYYSTNNDDELSRSNEIKTFVKNSINFFPIDTRKSGRISAEEIRKSENGSERNLYFICGSRYFARDMVNQLLESGASRKQIVVEDYDFK